jgi:hypothetical protein
MAGDLNAKHVDGNSQLSTRRGKLLCAYTDENSCLILGPDTTTTNQYNRPSPAHSRLHGHCHNQETLIPSAYDFVLCTMLGPPPGIH